MCSFHCYEDLPTCGEGGCLSVELKFKQSADKSGLYNCYSTYQYSALGHIFENTKQQRLQIGQVPFSLK